MTPETYVKGWCPGALRPMQSGDGLIVRVRPRRARLSSSQALGLCALSQAHGNGIIELTNRANLQLRGVTEASHPALVAGLRALELIDPDPEAEARRNIVVSPFWTAGDRTDRVARMLEARLHEMPDLPAKFGFAVDLGARPVLRSVSADIRLEAGTADAVLVRADGVLGGLSVTEAEAVDAVIELARWFSAHTGPSMRRMKTVVQACTVPAKFRAALSTEIAPEPAPGSTEDGLLAGVAFGQVDADTLERALQDTAATALTVTPWRMLHFNGAISAPGAPFILSPGDPLLRTDACPGAPRCAAATIETRALARRIAPHVAGRLHVSGCAKGCARGRKSDVTLVGRDGVIDLVVDGAAWDEPRQRDLPPDEILKAIG
ncbi:cobalamin biosynthesis protein CobG [Sulfitobacter sp. D35]|uniref:cobalamin biosynthesis protein CobG n=1 Tax=Sulfitobacter sp. D35 TaxID=3083252 RepID=UPI00296ECE93|nr:cobalamin biosynthesis protein CobG [Sulfitobacter sp. D35]MDW4496481.1 cobalamin biosynthesis protein CobG [Sulfitobacter sp. D35]